MNSIDPWITFFGIAIPLFGFAGSAIAFVAKLYLDRKDKRRLQFFELMQFLDSDRPLATKIAAIYELRSYREHREFIIRFCGVIPDYLQGSAVDAMKLELQATKEFFENAEIK